MSYFSPERISRIVNKITPSPIKRSFEYYNEAASNTDYFGNPDPYYFARPGFLANQMAMRPRKRARTTAPVRRRRFKRVVRKFKKRRASYARKQGRLAFAESKSRAIDVKYRVMVNIPTTIIAHGSINGIVTPLDGINFGQARNERDSDAIFIRGIRTEMIISNFNTTEPTFLNCAWIGAKSPESTQGGGGGLGLNFFRGYGAERGEDFAAPAIQSSLELTRGEINTDHWAVLKHKRYLLQAQGGIAVGSIQRGSDRVFKWWVPVKREFKFERQTSPNSKTPIFFVYWVSKFLANGGTIQGTCARVQVRCITAFTDSN